MSNYYPNDYKSRANNYNLLGGLAESLDNTEIPYDDNDWSGEIKTVQKSIERNAKDILNTVHDLISILNDEIAQDFDNKICKYVRNINKGQEVDVFPYGDWNSLSDMQEINFNISNWWLNEFKEIDLYNNKNVGLMLENVMNYWELYSSVRSNSTKLELFKIKNFLNGFKNELVNDFYEQLLNGNPYEYINSIYENKPFPELNKYNIESLLNMITNWNSKEEKQEYFTNYSNYLKTLDTKEFNNNALKFVDIFLGQNVNTVETYIEVRHQHKNYYRISKINFDNLIEIVEIDSKYELGLKEYILKGFKEISKYMHYLNKVDEDNANNDLEMLIKKSESVYLSKKLEETLPKNEIKTLKKI